MSESDTAPRLIAAGAEYELLTTGDGASFLLRFKPEGMVAHLSGEDAARFRSDYDAVLAQFPGSTPDQALAQLWDQGGYSWLATQDSLCQETPCQESPCQETPCQETPRQETA